VNFSNIKFSYILFGLIGLLLIGEMSGCSYMSYPATQVFTSSHPTIHKVAILPFNNLSKFPQGGDIFYKVFLADVVKNTNLNISQEGDVRAIYRQLEIFPGQQPSIEQMKIIASRLEVNYLIRGTILHMSEDRLRGGGINPEISVLLEVINVKTGKVIWMTHCRRDGEHYRAFMHFGMVDNITKLSDLVSQEIIQQWISKELIECTKNSQFL